MSMLQRLKAEGFDRSTMVLGIVGRPSWRVRCSQCDALVINGTATHEAGCPRQTRECAGCNAIVSGRARYCAECQS